jgi:hypothetical protein
MEKFIQIYYMVMAVAAVLGIWCIVGELEKSNKKK